MSAPRPPAAEEEFTDGMLDAFAADDDDRIAGLFMRFEGPTPPVWVRREWADDAKRDPLPPGVD